MSVVHSFLLTLYVHAAFVVFRKYAGGWHAETSRNCTVVSALFFILLPNVLYNYVANINIEFIIVFQVIALVIAARYSPADTEKNPLFSKSEGRQ
ncbi:accessory gene regulator B family protein [Lentilactobacillus diolivorans]|uniref:accessory gene regulator B family protein n=1 Tax=Lentilactobacillus diolivorans TaxID=179838 RepID=UPI003CC83547